MILITGIVKSGTSLLTLWLGMCGFDIGLTDKHLDWYKTKLTESDEIIYGRPPIYYPARGGLEFLEARNTRGTARQGIIPEVIKQPWGLYPESPSPMDRLEKFQISTPEPVILLHRRCDAIASSVYAVGMADNRFYHRLKAGSGVPSHREFMHIAVERYELLKNTYPGAIVVEFPRYVADFEYLWEQVGHIVGQRVNKQTAKVEFDKLADMKFVRH